MPDFTSLNLEAAFIDQKVAGAFPRKLYAFVAVIASDPDAEYALGVAVANEPGFNPIQGKTFKTWDEAKQWAEGLNAHIGLTHDEAFAIIASTMGGRPVNAIIWEQAQ